VPTNTGWRCTPAAPRPVVPSISTMVIHQHRLSAIDHEGTRETGRGTHDERRCQRLLNVGDQVDRADAVAGIKDLCNRGGDVAVDREVVTTP